MSLFPLSDEHSEDDGPKMHRVAFAAFFLGDESDLKGIHWKWSRECGYVQSAVSRQEKTTQNSCRSTWMCIVVYDPWRHISEEPWMC